MDGADRDQGGSGKKLSAGGRWFLFKLARDLNRTVAELEDSLSEREFYEWIAFYRMEGRRDDSEDEGSPVEAENDGGFAAMKRLMRHQERRGQILEKRRRYA